MDKTYYAESNRITAGLPAYLAKYGYTIGD